MSDRSYLQHGRRHGRVVTIGAPGSDPPPHGGRISYGQIGDTTVADEGSGDWTFSQVGDLTTITFDPPFASLPTVVVCPNEIDATPPYFTEVQDVALDHVDVQPYTLAGAPIDYGFNFIAIGSS